MKHKHLILLLLIFLPASQSCRMPSSTHFPILYGEHYQGPKIGDEVFLSELGLTPMEELPMPEKPLTLVAWINADCSLCSIRMDTWSQLIKRHRWDESVNIRFVGKSYSRANLAYQIEEATQFPYPIYHDSENKFFEVNGISERPLLQAFLLDQDEKVVWVGNPSVDSTLSRFFEYIIDSHS